MNNTTLDDIAGEIGFARAVTLSTWYGGRNLYVPATPAAQSLIVKLIGLEAAQRLAYEWGGTTLSVPTMWLYEEQRRNWMIVQMTTAASSPGEIARVVGLTERRVQQILEVLASTGLAALPASKVAMPA